MIDFIVRIRNVVTGVESNMSCTAWAWAIPVDGPCEGCHELHPVLWPKNAGEFSGEKNLWIELH